MTTKVLSPQGPLERSAQSTTKSGHNPPTSRGSSDLPSHFGEPFADPSIIPTELVLRSARPLVKVLLSGDGGDEILGGYQALRASLLANRYARAIPARLAKALSRCPRADPRELPERATLRGSDQASVRRLTPPPCRASRLVANCIHSRRARGTLPTGFPQVPRSRGRAIRHHERGGTGASERPRTEMLFSSSNG